MGFKSGFKGLTCYSYFLLRPIFMHIFQHPVLAYPQSVFFHHRKKINSHTQHITTGKIITLYSLIFDHLKRTWKGKIDSRQNSSKPVDFSTLGNTLELCILVTCHFVRWKYCYTSRFLPVNCVLWNPWLRAPDTSSSCSARISWSHLHQIRCNFPNEISTLL